jgi:hypothetical protein
MKIGVMKNANVFEKMNNQVEMKVEKMQHLRITKYG